MENQLALLDAAHIGTLHSFCLQLIRQHFHQLGLDPQIAILDERQTRPLELTVLDRLFAKHYAGDEPLDRAVRLLIREQGHGSDEPIRRLALKLHRFSQTLADPSDWIAKQLAFFRQSEPTRWRAWTFPATSCDGSWPGCRSPRRLPAGTRRRRLPCPRCFPLPPAGGFRPRRASGACSTSWRPPPRRLSTGS